MPDPTPLRLRRQSLGLSIRELERRTGIDRGRLSVIERGLVPSAEQMARIEAVLAAAEKKEDAT